MPPISVFLIHAPQLVSYDTLCAPTSRSNQNWFDRDDHRGMVSRFGKCQLTILTSRKPCSLSCRITTAVAGPSTPHPLTPPRYSEQMASAHIGAVAIIPGLPPPLPVNASCHMLIQHATQLRIIADTACTQVYHDHALLSLKDHENTALRQQLYSKIKTSPGKARGKGKGWNKKGADGKARHLTGDAVLTSLAQEEADVKERETVKANATAERKRKAEEAAAKKAEKAIERQHKAEEAAKKRAKTQAMQLCRWEEAERKKAEKEAAKAEREAAKAAKAVEKVAAEAAKVAERKRKAEEAAKKNQEKAAAAAAKGVH